MRKNGNLRTYTLSSGWEYKEPKRVPPLTKGLNCSIHLGMLPKERDEYLKLPPFSIKKINSTKLIFKENKIHLEEFGCFRNPIPVEKQKMGRGHYKRANGKWKPLKEKRPWKIVSAKSYWWKNLPEGWNIAEFEETKSKTPRERLIFKKRLEKGNKETSVVESSDNEKYHYHGGYVDWLSQIHIIPKNAELALKKASFNARYTKTVDGYIFPQLAATPLVNFVIEHPIKDTFQLGRHFIPNSEYLTDDPHVGFKVDYRHSSTTRKLDELLTIPPLFSLNSCECGAFYMAYDAIHDEDVCPMCGLVQENNYPLPEPEKFDPCSFYVKEPVQEVKPKKNGETDTTLVKVICKSCFKPSTIPYNQKKVSRCEKCGGKFRGVGIVQSQEIHDEFKPGKGEGDLTDFNNKDLEEDDPQKDVKKGIIKRDPINLNKGYKRKGLSEGENDARGEKWIQRHEKQIKEGINVTNEQQRNYHNQLEFHTAYKDKKGNFYHTGANKHGRLKEKKEILEDEMYAVGLDPSADKWLYQYAVDIIERVKLTKLHPGKEDDKVIRGVLYVVIEKYFPDFKLHFARKSSRGGAGVSKREFSIIKNNMSRWNLENESQRYNKSLKLHEPPS